MVLYYDEVSIQDSVFFGSASESFYGEDLFEAYIAGFSNNIDTTSNADINTDQAGAVISTLFSSGCFEIEN